MARYKMTVAYNGKHFYGWQRQHGLCTVQGLLEDALKTILRHGVEVQGAGRTDRGVHALGQVAHFDTPHNLDTGSCVRSLNHFLRPYIAVKDMQSVSGCFHARFDACWRVYHYRLHIASTPCPFLQDRAWHIRHPICMEAMLKAAGFFVGTHTFSAFRSSACQSASPVRTVAVCEWLPQQAHWCVRAPSFLHHQVRFMIGALVHVGLGRAPATWVQSLLQQGVHKPLKAPAHGLCLSHVEYNEYVDPH